MIALAWVAAILSLIALLTTLVNALTWARSAPSDGHQGPRSTVTVLVPARNEQSSIAQTVESALATAPPVDRVVVCDDGSTDDTPEILRRLGQRTDRLRVIQGAALPAGWVGKPHACHQLAENASTDALMFVDADVTLAPSAPARVEALALHHAADVVTVVPRQCLGTGFESLVMPMLHVTYTSWLPLALIPLTSNPAVLAANGQILWIRRQAYDQIGGFEAVRHEVVDDMAFCRNAKRHGLRVLFVDGHELAVCRMYSSAGEVWRGFSKNLYEGIGGHPVALVGVLALYGMAWIVPWGVAAAALAGGSPALALPGAVGVGSALLMRAVLALRHGHRWWSVLAHPVAVLVLLAIAVNSFRWNARGAISWAGRSYAARSKRLRAQDPDSHAG